ncbi:MAG: ABC transporter ATP-binding protein [Anaerolineaceae bacterium]|nr:ABC transporter ATP-binding protein [Anaerolineaceae bacterium]MDE0328742.1 ABC transporter ATP-binding protein [Anaerolineaceae bacterium]
MTIALACRQLGKRFETVQALRDFSLSLQAGQVLALLGPSGCGKTTTLRLIAGFESPDSGEIHIEGRAVAGPQGHVPPENRRVGMVFQDYALFPHLDVAGNISFGLKGSREQRRQRTETMLSLVGLEGFGARSLQGLSGGQQQRVALARALAPEPALVLLDEPFSNLDTHLRVRLRAEVRAILRATGTTAVFVTHDQEEALSVADQVAVMSAGRLLQVAEPWRLYHEPASRAVASLVGESNFLTAEASGRIARCAIGELELRQPAAGEVTLLLRPESLHVTGDGPLRVEEVQFFGDHQRLQLRLADNTALTAQTDNSRRFRAGQRVGVKVHGPVLALTV